MAIELFKVSGRSETPVGAVEVGGRGVNDGDPLRVYCDSSSLKLLPIFVCRPRHESTVIRKVTDKGLKKMVARREGSSAETPVTILSFDVRNPPYRTLYQEHPLDCFPVLQNDRGDSINSEPLNPVVVVC